MTFDQRPEDELVPPVPSEPGADPAVPAPQRAVKSERVRWGLIGFLILLVLIMIVALQNSQTTDLKFLAWSTPEVPLSVVILGTAVVAIILDELAGIAWRLRRRRRRKAAERAAS